MKQRTTSELTHRTTRAALRARSMKRGAAMAEGIVVMSVMLMFLGLIVWTRKAYGAKLDAQQLTRSDALYRASHGCEGSGTGNAIKQGSLDLPSNMGQSSNGATANRGTVGDPAIGGSTVQSAGLTDASSVNQQWNNSEATMSPPPITFQAIFDKNAGTGNTNIELQKRTLSSQVTGRSNVTCNEKDYSDGFGQFTAWVEFGIDFAVSGGGIAGLFQ